MAIEHRDGQKEVQCVCSFYVKDGNQHEDAEAGKLNHGARQKQMKRRPGTSGSHNAFSSKLFPSELLL